MHFTIMEWIQGVYHEHPDLFTDQRVLECGSRRVNNQLGTQTFFGLCPDYTGLDAEAGERVDVVSLVHEYEPDEPFDVVIAVQMLEHDPYWQQSIKRMVELVRPGGALILTWPAPDWARHELAASPTPGYYENRIGAEVLEAVGQDAFGDVQVSGTSSDQFLLALDRKG